MSNISSSDGISINHTIYNFVTPGQPISSSDSEIPIKDTLHETIEIIGALGIFIGFVIMALVWKSIYFFLIRRCCRIQRWPSLKKLEQTLDLYDHISHNTTMGIPSQNYTTSGPLRGGFLKNGLPFGLFKGSKTTHVNGLGVEVDMMARPVVVMPTGATTAAAAETIHILDDDGNDSDSSGGGGGGSDLKYNVDDYNKTTQTRNRKQQLQQQATNRQNVIYNEYVAKTKKSVFYDVWPWDEEYDSAVNVIDSDNDKYGIKPEKHKRCWTVFSRKTKRILNFIFCCRCCCRKAEKANDDGDTVFTSPADNREELLKDKWKMNSYPLVDLPLGYSYKGGHWIPRTIEGRRLSKYLRGNFLTLVGSVVSIVLILAGARMALGYADVNLTTSFTTAAGLALISFFKIAEIFAPVFAYFTILASDSIERGDLIELASNVNGFSTESGGNSLVGCVMDIGSFQVSLLCTKPYKTLSTIAGNDKVLDMKGNLTSYMALHHQQQQQQKQQTPSGVAKPIKKTKKSVSVNMTNATTNNTENNDGGGGGNKDAEGKGHTSGEPSAAIYLERDFIKTKMIVKIPTHIFASYTMGRHVSFIPVVNLQQIGRF